MAMGKGYKVWHKLNTQSPYSVLLEQRNRDESLLFESQVVAALGKSGDDLCVISFCQLASCIIDWGSCLSFCFCILCSQALLKLKSFASSMSSFTMPMVVWEFCKIILVGVFSLSFLLAAWLMCRYSPYR